MKRELCNRPATFMLVILTLLLCGQATAIKADPLIVVPGQGITVTGVANQVGGAWQYRYTITETSGIAVNQVLFIISEDATHAGIHHENPFLNANGVFRFDLVVPPPLAGIAVHNYSWSNLFLAANGVLTVGFDDLHGPAMAIWGIQGRGATVDRVNLLPVPSQVPESAPLLLLGTGLAGVAIKVRRKIKSS